MHEKIDFWYGHLVYHKVSTFLLRFVVVVTSLYTRAQVLFMSIHEFIQLFCLKIKCLHQIYWWES